MELSDERPGLEQLEQIQTALTGRHILIYLELQVLLEALNTVGLIIQWIIRTSTG